MPKFYTHILNDTTFTIDEEGSEFANLAAASKQAKQTVGAIIGEELIADRTTINLTVTIDDAEHVPVCHLRTVSRLVSSVSPFAD